LGGMAPRLIPPPCKGPPPAPYPLHQ
jgi:hypothetical protein